MEREKRIDARFLGGASLHQDGQALTGTAVRRHPLGLLALLVTAPGHALSRPKVVGLLWPEADETTGRNRLSSTLYSLRQALGADALTAAGDTLRLDPAALQCDLWRFREALDAEDYESAARHYGGPFMDGYYLDGSTLFEDWIERERGDLDRAWFKAVRTLAENAEKAGRYGEAAHRWRVLLSNDPLDSVLAENLVQALAAAGRRHEALKSAEQHVADLDKELGMKPDEVFMKIVERLRQQPVSPDETPEASIAVLMFDAPDDVESRTLGEGIHAGVLNRLTTVEGLTVIARTSIICYRDTPKTAAEIGAELGVRWVLEGGIHAVHGQFRVDARLVEARTNRQVWGYDYVGQLNAANYFSVQTEIADELFERLRHKVTPDERLRLAHVPTENLQAHRRSTEARMHLDQRSPESMQRALSCFEEAVELDPDYAVAWVGVGDTLGLMYAYGFAGPDVLPRAQQAISKALETDEYCAEAHAAHCRMLGQINDVEGAKQAMRRAIALKPGYAEAHNWQTIGYHVSGDLEAAFDSSRRSVALNPLSAEAVNNFASTLLFLGRPSETLSQEKKALEVEPGYGTANFFSALAYYEMGQFDKALETIQGIDLPWVGTGVDTVRALAHIGLGDLDSAQRLLGRIRKTAYPFDEGLVLAALGRRDAAIEAFARETFEGFEMAVGYWPTVCVRYLFKPIWNSLGDDPFTALLRRIDTSWGMS